MGRGKSRSRGRKRVNVHAIARIVRAELAKRGVPRFRPSRSDPYRTLVACLISLRTKDAVTGEASRRLFKLARNPREMLGVQESRIARAIYPAGFYRVKARHIKEISRVLVLNHSGRVPADMEGLLSLKGVGRKTANLVLGRGFGRPAICVDVHVHRISNRLGIVATRNPEETEYALMRLLPRHLWVEWNSLLVSFGQLVCAPVSPRCSECGLAGICARKGVKGSR